MKIRLSLLPILLILLIQYSCTNTSVKQEIKTDSTIIETDKYAELNSRLKQVGNIETPVELIKYYYGEIDAEEDVDIKVDKHDGNNFYITLIQENIKDDSIAGMMVVMSAQLSNNVWTVKNIDRTWKCQRGRGHNQYSSEPCI